MSGKRQGRPGGRRRSGSYAPAFDYGAAGDEEGSGSEPKVDDSEKADALYPDYTGLSTGGLGGPVAAVGTESRPTGIRVLSGRAAAEAVPSRGDPELVATGPEETSPGGRPAGERWALPPQPAPNPDGFRVSPAVRIIAPGTESAAPTARTPSDSPRARRRAPLPAIPAPRWTPDVLPRPLDGRLPDAPAVAHTATPGAAITPRRKSAPPEPEPSEQPEPPVPATEPPAAGQDELPRAGASSPNTMPARRPPSAPLSPRRLPAPPVGPPPGALRSAPPAEPPAEPAARPQLAAPSQAGAAPRAGVAPQAGVAPSHPADARPAPRPPQAPDSPEPPPSSGLRPAPDPSVAAITLNPRLSAAPPTTTDRPATVAGPAAGTTTSVVASDAPRAAAGDPGGPPAEERVSFSRNTSLMAAGTLIARLTGFGKVLALAWVLGSGRLADAFNLANNIPNSIYDLLLGGVLSATLIPVFVDELRKENRREGTRAISAVVTTIAALLVAITAIFWFITPAIIDLLLVSGQGGGIHDERHTAIQLLHLFVPQLPLLGAIAVSTALLNARRRFAAPAFSPILCNVVTIAAVIATKYVAHQVSLSDFQTDTTAVAVLGLGTTAGYLAQFLAQTPSVFRAGIRLRLVWNPGHPAVRTVLRLSVWTFGAVVTNQVSFYVIQLLANTKSGSVTSFNYAYQFFQLPYAIFAVSIASVIAPDLAQKWSNGQLRAFRARMGSGIRLTLAILFPAGVGYAIVAQPLLRLALRHGSYTVGQTQLTGDLVAIFAIGLPGFSVYLLLMRAYQSMKDTRSMFWCYCAENALTIAVGVSLYPLWGVRGLVLGWIGAYSVMAVVAFIHLRSRTGGLQGPAVLVTAIRVTIATGVMAAVLEGLDRVLPATEQLGPLVARVAVLLVAGSLVYITVALWLGVTEVRQVLRRGARSAR